MAIIMAVAAFVALRGLRRDARRAAQRGGLRDERPDGRQHERVGELLDEQVTGRHEEQGAVRFETRYAERQYDGRRGGRRLA